MNKLGKLEKVNLRDIWSNEEYDFSVWLSKEENLRELSNTIGIDIVLEERESSVGKYSLYFEANTCLLSSGKVYFTIWSLLSAQSIIPIGGLSPSFIISLV